MIIFIIKEIEKEQKKQQEEQNEEINESQVLKNETPVPEIVEKSASGEEIQFNMDTERDPNRMTTIEGSNHLTTAKKSSPAASKFNQEPDEVVEDKINFTTEENKSEEKANTEEYNFDDDDFADDEKVSNSNKTPSIKPEEIKIENEDPPKLENSQGVLPDWDGTGNQAISFQKKSTEQNESNNEPIKLITGDFGGFSDPQEDADANKEPSEMIKDELEVSKADDFDAEFSDNLEETHEAIDPALIKKKQTQITEEDNSGYQEGLDDDFGDFDDYGNDDNNQNEEFSLGDSDEF